MQQVQALENPTWRQIFARQPNVSVASKRHTSVASPYALHTSAFLTTTASLHNETHRSNSPTSVSSPSTSFILNSSRERSLLLHSHTPFPFQTVRTTIFPIVIVPVLSKQISEIPPSASSASRRRTMAFRRAISVTPFAKVAVTTAMRDSGIIARAREIAYNATVVDILNRDMANRMMTKITAVMNK